MEKKYKSEKQKSNAVPAEDSEASIRQDFLEMPMKGISGDGVDQMDNGFEFSQSEIIDFSHGADSQIEGNR